MSGILFTEIGFAHYLYWQMQDRKTLQKISRLLKSIVRDGALAGKGKPGNPSIGVEDTAAGLMTKGMYES